MPHARTVARLLSAGVLVLALGCHRETVRTVELDPLAVRARQTPAGTQVDVADAGDLFERGMAAWDRGEWRRAAAAFEELIELFPRDRRSGVAHFNAGVARARAGDWSKAVEHLEAYLAGDLSARDRADGLSELAAALDHLGRWDELDRVTAELVAADLDRYDRMQAWTLRGVALVHRHDLPGAEEAFRKALAIYRRHATEPLFRRNRWAARAQFEIGEIYRQLFEGIALRLPLDRMERDLDDKSRFFLRAQSAYLRAVRIGYSPVSVAAGFQLGSLYETFYRDLLHAEVPDSLTPEERAIYFQQLFKHIRPLVERAVHIFERNLRMAERSGVDDSDWVARTRLHLRTLRAVLQRPPTPEMGRNSAEPAGVPDASNDGVRRPPGT